MSGVTNLKVSSIGSLSNNLRQLPSQTYLLDWARLIESASAEAFSLETSHRLQKHSPRNLQQATAFSFLLMPLSIGCKRNFDDVTF